MKRAWTRRTLLAVCMLLAVQVAPTRITAQDATAMDCTPVDYQGPPATISFVWWEGGGDSPSDMWFNDAVACFNEKYAGTLVVDVEYVPGQHDYAQKLKTDYAASDTLPPIVTLK